MKLNEPKGTHQTYKRLLGEIMSTTHKLAILTGLTDRQFASKLLSNLEDAGFKIVRNEANVD